MIAKQIRGLDVVVTGLNGDGAERGKLAFFAELADAVRCMATKDLGRA
jgi:hypothetical protein